eukprot:CAMPEP_0195060048 /NCGR_PEP_ID=MMETSP0448-20130528/7402_1 /TAXON_ID=66468 /ORGANISM="Heterocapsa triquestra, Strain CCMP 448" /LENGTH=42 /DNA_ID= /DNA_START= /DNA_END= /DNA_ORIENTATION=
MSASSADSDPPWDAEEPPTRVLRPWVAAWAKDQLGVAAASSW